MTTPDLAALAALMEKATPLPFFAERNDKGASITILGRRRDVNVRQSDGCGDVTTVECAIDPDAVMFSAFNPEDEANAALIVAAVNALPALLAAAEDAGRLRKALEHIKQFGEMAILPRADRYFGGGKQDTREMWAFPRHMLKDIDAAIAEEAYEIADAMLAERKRP